MTLRPPDSRYQEGHIPAGLHYTRYSCLLADTTYVQMRRDFLQLKGTAVINEFYHNVSVATLNEDGDGPLTTASAVTHGGRNCDLCRNLHFKINVLFLLQFQVLLSGCWVDVLPAYRI